MYLGAGLGSLITQILLGLTIAVPIFVAVYWGRLWGMFKHNKKE